MPVVSRVMASSEMASRNGSDRGSDGARAALRGCRPAVGAVAGVAWVRVMLRSPLIRRVVNRGGQCDGVALDGVGGDIQEVFVPDSREKKIMEQAEEKQRMRYQIAIEKRRQNQPGSGLAQERGKKVLRDPSAANKGKSPVKSLSKGNGKNRKGQGKGRSKKTKAKAPISGEARAQKKPQGKSARLSEKGSPLDKSSSGRKPASVSGKKATTSTPKRK